MLQQLGRSPLNFLALLQGARALQGQPMMADEGDEAFLRRYQQQGFEGQPFNQPAGQQVMPNTAIAEAPNARINAALMQPAERGRVNPLNVLGRVLAPNTFQAIDSERARLQSEADRPQNMARINAVLQNIDNPIEQALFLGLGSEEWRSNVGQQFAPQVVAEGGAQRVAGTNNVYNNYRTREFGDSLVRDTPTGYETLGTRGMTYAEQNAANKNRIDEALGYRSADTAAYNAETGRMNAQTTRDNSGFTLGNGQVRYNPDGSQIAGNDSGSQEDAAKARARSEVALSTIGNARTALQRAFDQTNLLSTGTVSGLIPFNQARENLRANIDTIESIFSFAELQRMRENSPTGGALGGIAIRELELLGATVASLRQSQSPEEFRRSLEIMNGAIDRWEAAVRESMAGQGQPQGGGGQITPEQARAILRQRGVQGY